MPGTAEPCSVVRLNLKNLRLLHPKVIEKLHHPSNPPYYIPSLSSKQVREYSNLSGRNCCLVLTPNSHN